MCGIAPVLSAALEFTAPSVGAMTRDVGSLLLLCVSIRRQGRKTANEHAPVLSQEMPGVHAWAAQGSSHTVAPVTGHSRTLLQKGHEQPCTQAAQQEGGEILFLPRTGKGEVGERDRSVKGIRRCSG